MEDVNQQAAEKRRLPVTPCLCAALRQASRAVTRIYDAGLRATGLRVTQFALLSLLSRSGEVRQGDLGEMASLDETTLTRSLRPLKKSGWVTIRAGADRREKLVAITEAGKEKVEQARPAWSRAQERLRRALPDRTWDSLFAALPDVTKAASETTSWGNPVAEEIRCQLEIRWKSGVEIRCQFIILARKDDPTTDFRSGPVSIIGNPVSVHHSCPKR